MAWQLPCFILNRLAAGLIVVSAVSLSQASAMSFGQTLIKSHQHEPLQASFAIFDIDAATFKVQLASPAMYQTMGLHQDRSMTVSFTPTSATSGDILIQTHQPISAPFSDVVLDLNHQGLQKIIPKTLLMPLKDQVVLSASAKPADLPIDAAALLTQSQPLQVRYELPPPLFASDSQPNLLAKSDLTTVNSSLKNEALKNEALLAKSVPKATPLTVLPAELMPELTPSVVTPRDSQILNAQSQQKDRDALTDSAGLSQKVLANHDKLASDNQKAPSYVVKRHDNLWQIAKQGAQTSPLDIQNIMTQIQTKNPEAFVAKDPNRLKLDAKLDLLSLKTADTIKSPAILTINQSNYYQRSANESAPSAPFDLVLAKNESAARFY